jgi:DNA-binding SARP family transcriptional activator/tetratricopeptide (TPR) repeat protein
VRFRILGPLEIWTGQDWSGIGAPKWRALLAALLLNSGQVVSTDRLIAELWGTEPPERAANLVSVYVLRLRRLMGDPHGRLLATRAPGYQLRLDPGDLDASAFENLVSQGRRALGSGEAPQAAALLTDALALWRSAALADVPHSSLVSAEAERLAESRLAALELRITADLRCGRAAQLIPELRRLISDEPLREGLWALLLQSLDGAGRRAEAVAVYGDARRAIADELGVDPGPELKELYSQLLAADGAAQPPGSAERPSTAEPPGTTTAPGTTKAGRPRAAAASATTPEPPVQPGPAQTGTAAPGSDDDPPAQSSRTDDFAGGAPAQLPADIADFTGRLSHLARLRSLLAAETDGGNPEAVNVAGVVGTPGLGKTVLAVHAAHEVRREFPDGQLFVRLLGASPQPAKPDEVLARLLRDLGVEPGRIPASLDERAALYRTRLTDRRVLIVLDDARDAAQVRPLLPGSASCAVIVTSRHWLADLAGSRLVDLDVLDDEEALQLLTRIISEERVAAEPGPVREVLAACAGLPLAIRIAGARLAARRGWSVRTLALRLADQQRRLDELTAGDLAVRACFEVSFTSLPRSAAPGDLDPAEAFRLLGLWQGPFISLQAAAALLGRPEYPVADALEVLVDMHLLESPAPEWYRFHDLLRAYAAERAKAEETEETTCAAIARLLRWYLRTADEAVRVINPNRALVELDAVQLAQPGLSFDSADAALAWSARERANLVAATRQAAAEGLHDIAWKLPVAVMVCFDRHGYRAEWLATHQVALASARTAGDRAGEAWVLNNLGIVVSQQRAEDSTQYFEQALAIRRDLGDLRGQAQATNNLAFSYQFRGMHQRAADALHDALEIQRKVGHRYGESVALTNLGEAYIELGRDQEAITYLQQALPIAREIDSARDEGYVLCNLGRARLSLGQVAEGTDLLEQALALHGAEGDKYGEAQDRRHLGTARVQTGQTEQARAHWERAASLFEGLGDDDQAAEIHSRLAKLGVASASS